MLKTGMPQELMTPDEASKWFRRSPSWLRQQRSLLRFGDGKAQPLFHVDVCRAYVLGKLSGLADAALRDVQLKALAAHCKVEEPGDAEEPDSASVPAIPEAAALP